MKELLTTLASGDNFSKILLVIVLLVTGGNFFKIGNQGDETRSEVEKFHLETRQQIKLIYNYQQHYIDLIKGIKRDNNKMLTHFGLAPSDIPDPPPLQPLPTPYP